MPASTPTHSRDSRAFDRIAVPLAMGQHGVVTRRQLLEAGVPDHVVDHRVSNGRLFIVHRGVYLLEELGTPESPLLAACLACGPRALLSHVPAGVHWRLLRGIEMPAVLDVSGPDLDRRRPGIRVHRCRTLGPSDGTRRNGIPITRPARTLIDLAPTLSDRQLDAAVAEALARDLVRPRTLRAAARRWRSKAGAGRVLERASASGLQRVRSEAEERFLALIRGARVPEPRVNARVAGLEVDFYWPEARLVVEVDGFEFHRSLEAFERDRARDAKLVVAGFRVIRVTWQRLTQQPGRVLTSVMRVLRDAGPGLMP